MSIEIQTTKITKTYLVYVLYKEGKISDRAYRALAKAGVKYLSELEIMTMYEVKRIKGIGPKLYTEIKEFMNSCGLYFRDDPDNYPRNAIYELLPVYKDGEEPIISPGYSGRFEEVLKTLSYEEQMVLRYFYEEGLRYAEIAKLSFGKGWTKERVRQSYARAIRKLRHPNRLIYIVTGKKPEKKPPREFTEEEKERIKKMKFECCNPGTPYPGNLPDSYIEYALKQKEATIRKYKEKQNDSII